ncbi:META domain-containing protein [Nakamurella sp. YIM 132087]|uniref:META domain-containing protein n=1 Tax=Nakamurella alba TaxID=2665158 RepID=A0A7K1FHQ4_9ACTN|nr:META domain-containing protein [Nakamurella alba]MTD12813.1 META domain-containing protein [Nakamurella alba]
MITDDYLDRALQGWGDSGIAHAPTVVPEFPRERRHIRWGTSALLAAAVVALLLVGFTAYRFVRPAQDVSTAPPALSGSATESAPAAEAPDPRFLLYGIRWRMTSAVIDGEPRIAGNDGATLEFGENTANGSNGCNNVWTHISVSPDTIRFSGFATTQALCPPDELVGDVYPGVMSGNTRWAVKNDTLTLTAANGDVFIYFGRRDPQALLYGITWRMTSATINGDIKDVRGRQLTLAMGPGLADGHYGCNTFSFVGTTVTARTVTFPATGSSTAMACAPDMVVGDVYPRRLQGDTEWTVSGNVLTLITQDGSSFTFTGTRSLAAEVYGVKWRLDAVIVDGIRRTPYSTATVEFSDGKVSGTEACNYFDGTVVADDREITIGPRFMSEAPCRVELLEPGQSHPDSTTAQRFSFGDAQVTWYRVRDTLYLNDVRGTFQWELTPCISTC